MTVPFGMPEVKIVAASAGAGKTYALATRYVQLLFHPSRRGPDSGRGILAITFTNKASREMKERILELLKRLVLGTFRSHEERTQFLSALAMDEEQAGQAASQSLDYLIRNYNFFQVKTIDSFMNALLVGCAFKLNLSAGFKIQHVYEDYVAYSMDTLIERSAHNRDIRRLFEAFLRQYLYIENKRSWLPKQDMLSVMSAMFFQQNTFGRQFRQYDMRGADILSQQHQVRTLLANILERLPDQTQLPFRNALADYLEKHPAGFNVRAFAKSKLLLKDEIPLRKGAAMQPVLHRLWRSVREQIATVARAEAYSLFNCYIDLFAQVSKEFRARTSQDDVVFVSELNRYAHFLVAHEATSVPELYYRLATRFRHYLMDEFQDTSVLQWQNLRSLIEEALSTGGTLFCVGDRKQSIYRFRGGEPALFTRVAGEFAHFNVTAERLGKNYRSREHIVACNNELFSAENVRRLLEEMCDAARDKDADSPLLLGPAQLDALVEPFADSRQSWRPEKDGGVVRFEVLCPGPDEDAESIARERVFTVLEEVLARWPRRDITVLCRVNDEVEMASEWLISRNIPVASEKTLKVTAHPLIKELLSFLMFLDSPVDELAFASFISGEIFCRGASVSAEKMRDFLFAARRDRSSGAKPLALYRGFQKTFPQIWDAYIEEFFKTANLVPLYELVSRAYQRYCVLVHFPEDQGFFMRLLELITRQEDECPTIGQFVQFLGNAPSQETYVSSRETDAVRVMTVHKAKGLEFPVVIAPFLRLDPKPEMSSDRGRLSYLIEDTAAEDELGLVRLHTAYTRFVPEIKELYSSAYAQSLRDELNALYVACTRASDELYAFIPERSGRSRNPLVSFVPDVWRRRGEPQPVPPREQAVSAALTLRPGTRRDWLGFLAQEFSSGQELSRRLCLQRGEILHALCAALITVPDMAAIPGAVARAVAMARPRFSHIRDFDPYARALEQLLRREEIFSFFRAGRDQVRCEQEVVTAEGLSLRIDRLMIGEQEVRVIDIKSGAEPAPHHIAQVREYCRVAAQLFPGRAVKGYLLLIESERIMAVT